MTTSSATTKTATAAPQAPAKTVSSVVAVYRHHSDAEDAVRRLQRAGIPMHEISIIGRNFELREDVQGYYRPSDAALEGAGFGAWVGGLFGVLAGRRICAPRTSQVKLMTESFMAHILDSQPLE